MVLLQSCMWIARENEIANLNTWRGFGHALYWKCWYVFNLFEIKVFPWDLTLELCHSVHCIPFWRRAQELAEWGWKLGFHKLFLCDFLFFYFFLPLLNISWLPSIQILIKYKTPHRGILLKFLLVFFPVIIVFQFNCCQESP